MADYVPYILSVFSNPPDGEPGHLRFVDDERKKLQQLFDEVEINLGNIIRYISHTDELNDALTIRSVSDRIEQWKKRNTIIHYSGHAEASSLTIHENDLRAVNFIKSIEQCENLKVVVLNACGTQGFVRKLLENTSVKAVIATTNPVRDDRAMTFAAWFYKKLLERLPLVDAFTYAVARALENSGDYEDNSYVIRAEMDKAYKITGGQLLFDRKDPGMQFRGTKKKIDLLLEKTDEPATWGLYTKSDDVLDWKVFENLMPAEAQKEQLETEKKRLELANFKEVPTRDSKREELREFEELLTATPGKQVLVDIVAKLKGEIKTLEDTIEGRKKQINEINGKLIQISEEWRDDMIISSYKQKLPELNYNNQETFIDAVSTAARNNVFQGFVLHGTPNCCLNHLSRKIARWLGISNIEKVIYDFESSSFEDFWQQLKNTFTGVNGNSPEAIVNALYSQFVDAQGSTQKDFVFLFRNFTARPGGDKHIERIFAFWKQLTELWNVHKAPLKIRHHIYAFIIDSNCELTLVPEVKSSRQESYQALIKQSQLFQNPISLVPVVEPLKATEIERWEIKECGLDTKLRIDEDELISLLQKTGGFFSPTLRSLSELKIANPPKRTQLLTYIQDDIETAQL
jgi:hypothetical protein